MLFLVIGFVRKYTKKGANDQMLFGNFRMRYNLYRPIFVLFNNYLYLCTQKMMKISG
jgi:hypothetical protein